MENAGAVHVGDDLGSGFAFDDATPDDIFDILICSSSWYHESDAWKRLQRRVMLRDFGRRRSVQRYLELYVTLLGGTSPRLDERLSDEEDRLIAPASSGWPGSPARLTSSANISEDEIDEQEHRGRSHQTPAGV